MTPMQWVLGYAGSVLLGVTLAGVLARRKYRECYAFAFYLAVALSASILIGLWPSRFFVWQFWLLKQRLYDGCRFTIALEIAFRTFRAFPGASRTLRAVLLVVLGFTFLAIMSLSTGAASPGLVPWTMHPRLLNGTLWLFTAEAALILWYRLPMRPFPKAILVSYVPYLAVFTAMANALATLNWDPRGILNHADPLAYTALVAYWAYAAWRRDTPREAMVRPAAAERTEETRPGAGAGLSERACGG